MDHCKYRTMDKCGKTGGPCTFDKHCFEPEETPTRTNADQLNAISSEEKAKKLTALFYQVAQSTNAEHYILEWLQQPAEENC